MPCCGCMCIQKEWDSPPPHRCSVLLCPEERPDVPLFFSDFQNQSKVFHQLHLQAALWKGVQQLHGICSVNSGFARIRQYKTQHPSLTNKDFLQQLHGKEAFILWSGALCCQSTIYFPLHILYWKVLIVLKVFVFIFCYHELPLSSVDFNEHKFRKGIFILKGQRCGSSETLHLFINVFVL